jgi:hypothetical protein
MSRAATAVTLVTALALGLGACSSSDDSSPTSSDVPVDGVSVDLVDPGETPSEPLVWFSDPDQQKSTFKATQGWEQHTIGGDAPSDGAGDGSDTNGGDDGDTSAGATASEDADDPDSYGDIPYEDVTMQVPLTASASTDGENLKSKVTAGTPSGSKSDLNEDIATADGFMMSQQYGQDGRVSERSYTAPESTTGTARANIEPTFTQMTDIPLVFPTDPVGAGAQWTVTGQVDDNGTAMQQKVTYTLVTRDGSHVELKIGIDRTPTVRHLQGTDLEILSSHSESGGSLSLDLRRPLPVSGAVETATTVTYGQKGSPVSVVQTYRSKSVWEPVSDN